MTFHPSKGVALPIEANSAAYEPYYQLYHNTYAAIKPICHALGEME